MQIAIWEYSLDTYVEVKRFNSTVHASLFSFYLPMIDVFVTGIISGLVSITGERHKTIKMTKAFTCIIFITSKSCCNR